MLVPAPPSGLVGVGGGWAVWGGGRFRKWEVPRDVVPRLARAHLQPSHRKPPTNLSGLETLLCLKELEGGSHLLVLSLTRVQGRARPRQLSQLAQWRGPERGKKQRGNTFPGAPGGSVLCSQVA